jgi:HrpA-like RNA helicase
MGIKGFWTHLKGQIKSIYTDKGIALPFESIHGGDGGEWSVVLIDGYNLARELMDYIRKKDFPNFVDVNNLGFIVPDYNKFHEEVILFMETLKSCRLIPIVFIDSNISVLYPEKFEENLERKRTRLISLQNVEEFLGNDETGARTPNWREWDHFAACISELLTAQFRRTLASLNVKVFEVKGQEADFFIADVARIGKLSISKSFFPWNLSPLDEENKDQYYLVKFIVSEDSDFLFINSSVDVISFSFTLFMRNSKYEALQRVEKLEYTTSEFGLNLPALLSVRFNRKLLIRLLEISIDEELEDNFFLELAFLAGNDFSKSILKNNFLKRFGLPLNPDHREYLKKLILLLSEKFRLGATPYLQFRQQFLAICNSEKSFQIAWERSKELYIGYAESNQARFLKMIKAFEDALHHTSNSDLTLCLSKKDFRIGEVLPKGINGDQYITVRWCFSNEIQEVSEKKILYLPKSFIENAKVEVRKYRIGNIVDLSFPDPSIKPVKAFLSGIYRDDGSVEINLLKTQKKYTEICKFSDFFLVRSRNSVDSPGDFEYKAETRSDSTLKPGCQVLRNNAPCVVLSISKGSVCLFDTLNWSILTLPSKKINLTTLTHVSEASVCVGDLVFSTKNEKWSLKERIAVVTGLKSNENETLYQIAYLDLPSIRTYSPFIRKADSEKGDTLTHFSVDSVSFKQIKSAYVGERIFVEKLKRYGTFISFSDSTRKSARVLLDLDSNSFDSAFECIVETSALRKVQSSSEFVLRFSMTRQNMSWISNQLSQQNNFCSTIDEFCRGIYISPLNIECKSFVSSLKLFSAIESAYMLLLNRHAFIRLSRDDLYHAKGVYITKALSFKCLNEFRTSLLACNLNFDISKLHGLDYSVRVKLFSQILRFSSINEFDHLDYFVFLVRAFLKQYSLFDIGLFEISYFIQLLIFMHIKISMALHVQNTKNLSALKKNSSLLEICCFLNQLQSFSKLIYKVSSFLKIEGLKGTEPRNWLDLPLYFELASRLSPYESFSSRISKISEYFGIPYGEFLSKFEGISELIFGSDLKKFDIRSASIKKVFNDEKTLQKNNLMANDLIASEFSRLLHFESSDPISYEEDMCDEFKKTSKHLVIDDFEQRIIDLLKNNNAVIIEGETGCGKSSRVPQMIYNNKEILQCKTGLFVVITQPRRMAAISLAKRVSSEMDCELGRLVGYAIGQEKEFNSETSILYVTTGWLLQMLLCDIDFLSRCSHLILDEIHERSYEQDLLCSVLKSVISSKNSELHRFKLLVMSATVDSNRYLEFFHLDESVVIQVTTRKYPVDIYHLDELKECSLLSAFTSKYADAIPLSASTVTKVALSSKQPINATNPKEIFELASWIISSISTLVQAEGVEGQSILVFLSGMQDIEEMYELLEQWLDEYELLECTEILILHSSIEDVEKEKIFDPILKGWTRIILSTNISETSLTIPNVKYIIDFGTVKQIMHQPKSGFTFLEKRWISRASATQRAGRVGRTAPGIVFRMYPRVSFDKSFDPYDTPELLRVSLSSILLRLKVSFYQNFIKKITFSQSNVDKISFQQSPSEILKNTLQPPSEDAILSAYEELLGTNALSLHEDLQNIEGECIDESQKFSVAEFDASQVTQLGIFVASLPIGIKLARLLAISLVCGGTSLKYLIVLVSMMSVDRVLVWLHPAHAASNIGLLLSTTNAVYSFGKNFSDLFFMLELYREINNATASLSHKKSISGYLSEKYGLNMKKVRRVCTLIKDLCSRIKNQIFQKNNFQYEELSKLEENAAILNDAFRWNISEEDRKKLSIFYNSFEINAFTRSKIHIMLSIASPELFLQGYRSFSKPKMKENLKTSISNPRNSDLFLLSQKDSANYKDILQCFDSFEISNVKQLNASIQGQKRQRGRRKKKDSNDAGDESEQKAPEQMRAELLLEFKSNLDSAIAVGKFYSVSDDSKEVHIAKLEQVPKHLFGFKRMFFREECDSKKFTDSKVSFKLELTKVCSNFRPSLKWKLYPTPNSPIPKNAELELESSSILTTLYYSSALAMEENLKTYENLIELTPKSDSSKISNVPEAYAFCLSIEAEGSSLNRFRVGSLSLIPSCDPVLDLVLKFINYDASNYTDSNDDEIDDVDNEIHQLLREINHTLEFKFLNPGSQRKCKTLSTAIDSLIYRFLEK